MSLSEEALSLRMAAYACVPDLPTDRGSALALLEGEVKLIEEGKRGSTLFASGIPTEDARAMLAELIWLVSNHLYAERA